MPNSDKYDACPLQALGFQMVRFTELPDLVLGADGKRLCTRESRCLDVDKRDGQRCTLEQLKQLDRAAIRRRAWQSGEY